MVGELTGGIVDNFSWVLATISIWIFFLPLSSWRIGSQLILLPKCARKLTTSLFFFIILIEREDRPTERTKEGWEEDASKDGRKEKKKEGLNED